MYSKISSSNLISIQYNTYVILYTKFLVVHLLYYNNYYVGSVKLSDWLLVWADIWQLLAIGLFCKKIYIGTSLEHGG